jgi:hypothetical protein
MNILPAIPRSLNREVILTHVSAKGTRRKNPINSFYAKSPFLILGAPGDLAWCCSPAARLVLSGIPFWIHRSALLTTVCASDGLGVAGGLTIIHNRLRKRVEQQHGNAIVLAPVSLLFIHPHHPLFFSN